MDVNIVFNISMTSFVTVLLLIVLRGSFIYTMSQKVFTGKLSVILPNLN